MILSLTCDAIFDRSTKHPHTALPAISVDKYSKHQHRFVYGLYLHCDWLELLIACGAVLEYRTLAHDRCRVLR